MNKKHTWSCVALLTWSVVLSISRADPAPTAAAILGLCNGSGTRIDAAANGNRQPQDSDVGLNSWLWVILQTSAEANEKLAIATQCKGLIVKPTNALENSASQEGQQGASPPLVSPVQLNPSQYTLIIDGQQIQGLDEIQYDASRHAFGFRLTRNAKNKSVWSGLLGSPSGSHRTVTVALRLLTGSENTPSIIGGTNGSATFRLQVFSWPWFWAAVVVVALVLIFVVGTAWRTTTLRDTLLPQLPPKEQPYSLGRCQMAFWFILVFASFIFLYVLLWDYDTVSGQALALMGIASATALASIAVDVYKDSPADAANRALQSLGINTCADVPRIKAEMADRTALVKPAAERRDSAQAAAAAANAASERVANDPNATPAQRSAAKQAAEEATDLAKAPERDLKTLQGEIQDRGNILRTYDDIAKRFRTESFFRDLTTDLNGPTVHRLQVLFWTLALGGVFVVGVYRDLAMPNFSSTLLALMGISGAGYVGFKYPESND